MMKNLLGVTLIAALLVFFFDIAVSQAQSLPYEIDYVTYHKKYLTLKADSDKKLGQLNIAEDALLDNQSHISELVTFRDQLVVEQAQTQQNLQNNRSQQNQLSSAIAQINAQIQSLRQAAQTLNQTIAGLKSQIDREIGQMRPLEAQREQTFRTYVNVEVEFNARKQDEANLIKEVRHIEHNIDNAQKSLQNTTNDLNALENQNRNNQSRLNQIAQEIPAQQSQINSKNNQVRGLEQEIATINSQIANVQTTLGQKRQLLQQLQQGGSTTQASINSLKKEISQIESQIASLNGEVNNNRASIVKLKQDKILIPQKIAKNNEQIKQLESRISGLQSQITNLRSQNTKLESQRANVNAKIRELQGQVGREAELAALREQLKELSKEIAKNTATISKSESQIPELNSQIAKARSENTALNSQLSQVDSKISSLESANNSKIAQINQLSAKVQSLNQQIAALNGQAGSNQSQITAVQSEILRLENQMAQLNQQKNQKSQQVSQLKTQIQAHTNKVAQLQNEEREIKQATAQFSVRRNKFIERINQLKTEIRTGKNLLSARIQSLRLVQASLNQLTTRLNQLVSNLDHMDRDLAARVASINNLTSHLQGYEQALAQNNSDQARAQDDLSQTQSSLSQARSDESAMLNRLNEIAQDIPQVDVDLVALRRATVGLEQNVARTNEIYLKAQMLTDNTHAQYDQRYALFSDHANAAKNFGTLDSSKGSVDGEAKSQKDVVTAAGKSAQSYVLKLAPVDSKLRAMVRGEVQGYQQGLDLGLASSSDIQAGRAQGISDSNAKAKIEAETIHLAQYKAEKLRAFLAKDLATLPIDIDAGSSSQKNHEAQEFFLSDFVSQKLMAQNKSAVRIESASDLDQAEINASLDLKTALDTQITKLIDDERAIVASRSTFADAGSVYVLPTGVVAPVASAVSCSKVYKGLEIFKKMCVEAFKQSYVGKFQTAHQMYFYDHFSGLFEQNVDGGFVAERTKKYSEHKASAIAVTKKEGEIVGRAQARSASYDQAFAQNYPVALDREKARVDNVATEQINALERSQAVVALNRDKYSLTLDAKLGAAPGTDVALNLELKNLGLKANTLGLVQLEVIESENVENAQKVVLIKDLPAKANIHLQNVLKFKVSQRAVPGQDFKLKLRLTAHDGVDFGNRIQEFVVTERVRVNPEATSQLSFEAKPKLRKMIIPGIVHVYPKHQIGVQLKALFAGLSQGYEVEINAINEDKHKVEILNTVGKTKVLRQNESETIYFTYKFKKKARKQTVQFKVLVKYMGELMREENLRVTPE